jgi:hypothetical protein
MDETRTEDEGRYMRHRFILNGCGRSDGQVARRDRPVACATRSEWGVAGGQSARWWLKLLKVAW